MTTDVTARLAAGRPSVSNTQAYVAACHAVGYQHPDLTAHGAQIVEWYGGEEGLDLHALDADCATLRNAAAAADEAVRVLRDGHTAVLAAWRGKSGSSAADFIERHCATGAAVAGTLHAASTACEALRDALSRAVEEKVGAAISIDDRRAGERPAWLAAATTVTSGGAARDDAVAVVTEQITPYVDADIRTEWIASMRSSTSSVVAAYAEALHQLSAAPAAYFEVPGRWDGPPDAGPRPVPTAPAGVIAAASPPEAPATESASAPPMPDTTAAQPLPTTPMAEMPPQPSLGPTPSAGVPGMADVGGGLSGLVGQIADAFGGLFDGVPDTGVGDEPPQLEDPAGPDIDKPEPDETDPDIGCTEEAVPEDVPVADEVDGGDGAPSAEPAAAADVEPPEPLPSPPVEPSDEMAEPFDEQTPCEIAADELAQVGQ
ncbi:hypothetical protein ORI20_19335 [Mycobacterium sp. CVI_P3]|uniref:Uncharacterized protein n=1 Tax=Mycobacterium pinniadriaticum TaxID=2994102 RepID=A0ABT3SJ81_9MYCO|nr:hypothetical protein [Mycobacterium pinniadriaticum]MCX2932431.1 hypothetical protein [Mycobacterium pinniadriaticum]MCX2938935.1 hypothetical protein [Mycobacterium pinniadriaticum]